MEEDRLEDEHDELDDKIKKEHKSEDKHDKKKEHKEKHHSRNEKNFTDAVRKNPWIASTIILGVVFLVLLVGGFGGATGNVSKNKVSENLNDFLQAKTSGAEILQLESYNNYLYQADISLEGQEIPLYITKDGKFLVQGLTPLELETSAPSTPAQTNVPKSDKPIVELFIWSYCPYGVLAQGPLAEVASLLEGTADFNAKMYYAGHGAYEEQQNKIQACIQEVAPEKYWAYATGFVDDIYPKCGATRDIDCDKTESVKLMNSLGINSNSVLSCVGSKGTTLISGASARAKELGVTGSPTLVINGVKSNAGRTADAYKTAVCGAFTNAPEECGTTLSSDAAAAAGNC